MLARIAGNSPAGGGSRTRSAAAARHPAARGGSRQPGSFARHADAMSRGSRLVTCHGIREGLRPRILACLRAGRRRCSAIARSAWRTGLSNSHRATAAAASTAPSGCAPNAGRLCSSAARRGPRRHRQPAAMRTTPEVATATPSTCTRRSRSCSTPRAISTSRPGRAKRTWQPRTGSRCATAVRRHAGAPHPPPTGQVPRNVEAVQPPSDFDALATRLRDAITDVRADISVYELPAPRRVAPDAVAVGAAVENGDVELAAGRLVLLHDPEGQPAWEGTSRFVCYARAVLDEEMAADPMLPAVTWSWLMEALGSRGAGHRAAGGTVTVTSSRRFGALAEPGALLDTEGAEGCRGGPARGGAALLVDSRRQRRGRAPAGLRRPARADVGSPAAGQWRRPAVCPHWPGALTAAHPHPNRTTRP